MPDTEWPPKFQPHDRVLDHLVGTQLYTSTDTAVRELLQNAEDACSLWAIDAEEYEPSITVAYSPSENWCEFKDNGLGMNRDSVSISFTRIGAPKTEVEHIRRRLERAGPGQRQIGAFGIGILSCFGVASAIEVRTAMEGDAPIALRATGYHAPFEELQTGTVGRGTSIRLELKPNGPMKAADVPAAVKKYARHAHHVRLFNADTGIPEDVGETWISIPDGSIEAEIPESESVIGGKLALDLAWTSGGHAFGAELVTCNGGFLVSSQDRELVHQTATGFRGELDIVPGALNILMNREGFAKDDKWTALSGAMAVAYGGLIERLLDKYEQAATAGATDDAIERGVLLLAKGGIRGALQPGVIERIDRLVPVVVTLNERGLSHRISLARIAERVGERGTVYYVREDEQQRQRTRSYSDDSGASFQVMETLSTTGLRAAQLQASGKLVVSCKQREIGHITAAGNQSLRITEFDLLSQYASQHAIPVVSVNDVAPELVELSPLPESSLITDVFEAADGIRLVSLPTSSARVIPDYSGRLLNAAHPDVKTLLKALPAAAGNPVLRVLIQAYVDIDNMEYNKAASRLRDLLQDPHLADNAQLTTSPHLRSYLESRLEALTGDNE